MFYFLFIAFNYRGGIEVGEIWNTSAGFGSCKGEKYMLVIIFPGDLKRHGIMQLRSNLEGTLSHQTVQDLYRLGISQSCDWYSKEFDDFISNKWKVSFLTVNVEGYLEIPIKFYDSQNWEEPWLN